MSQCTAPVLGHIRGGGADCPVRGRGGGYGYAPPRSYTFYAAWQPSTSTVSHTPQQVRDLEPVRAAAGARTQEQDLLLCHAWPDCQADAKVAYDLLVGEDVSVER